MCVPDALIKYGNSRLILKLSELYPYFAKDKQFLNEQAKYALNRANIVPTTTIGGVVRIPLRESIQKVGKDSFLMDASDLHKSTWLLQIPRRLLTAKNLNASGQLFVVEKGVTTFKYGTETISFLGKENDMRICAIPEEGWTKTTQHPPIFGKGIEELDVYLEFPRDNVKVGAFMVGEWHHSDYGNGIQRKVKLSESFYKKYGLLTYVDAQKALEELLPGAQKILAQLSRVMKPAILQPLEELVKTKKPVEHTHAALAMLSHVTDQKVLQPLVSLLTATEQ